MKGSEFAEALKGLSKEAIESSILIAYKKNWTPDWIDDTSFWRPVSVTANIKGTDYTLVFYCSPDYFSVGTNDDFLRMPARPATYQAIANKLNAILPSRRLVSYIQGSAKWKITPKPQTPDMSMITVPVFQKYNKIVQDQLIAMGGSVTTGLVSGDKKDVVVGPSLDGSRVAIFGWYYPDGKLLQPYSTIHTVDHVDYSHGGRFILRKCAVNGKGYMMEDLFMDPLLYPLVSDQGMFKPYFPNTEATKTIDFNNPDYPREFEDTQDDTSLGIAGAALAGIAAYFMWK